MQITWHGLNCIRIQGKEVSVVMDPYSEKNGVKLPRFQGDIVTVSSDDLAPEKVGGNPFIIETPGEYEIKGVFIYGLPWRRENVTGKSVLFRVNIDGLSIGHLGGLDRKVPNSALEVLEGIDILFLPVGDPELLKPNVAVEEVISRIEPRIIIPMSFQTKGVKKKLNTPDDFYKQLGLKPVFIDKLKILRKDLPEEERLVYQLEAQ